MLEALFVAGYREALAAGCMEALAAGYLVALAAEYPGGSCGSVLWKPLRLGTLEALADGTLEALFAAGHLGGSCGWVI